MAIVVTGTAGFIGMHTALRLLQRGDAVIGIDNVNDYYDPQLKRARLAVLQAYPAFDFLEADVNQVLGDGEALPAAPAGIVHLSAQPGVRYAMEKPQAYIAANVASQVTVLEWARQTDGVDHVVYASSSSVYGENPDVPWLETARTDQPVSLYAATKGAAELITTACAKLYGIGATGLRFFTVYGPWGRPDMAPYLFTDALMRDTTIRLFNYGQQERDFSYIDDIVTGILRALDQPAPAGTHRLYNLGNSETVTLDEFVRTLEEITGRKARLERVEAQPGDVTRTFADIGAARRDLGYAPETGITKGLAAFVDWYRDYHRL